MNEWLLAIALLCTDTGRRGVCVREREREGGGENGRTGVCVQEKTKRVYFFMWLKWGKRRRGMYKIEIVCVCLKGTEWEGCVL